MGLAPCMSLRFELTQTPINTLSLSTTPHDSLTLSLSLYSLSSQVSVSHHKYPYTPPPPSSPFTQNSKSSIWFWFEETKLFKKKDRSNDYQKIKPSSTNSCAEANSQEVLKLGEETTLWWTRPPFGCPQGPFCGLCWRKQKQIHYPNLLLDSPWVPKLASSSRRRIWIWPRHGSHNSLWRSCFSVINIYAQVKKTRFSSHH